MWKNGLFSEKMTIQEKKLKNFKKKMYMHPTIKTMNIKSKKIISDLFELFIKEPDLLPQN